MVITALVSVILVSIQNIVIGVIGMLTLGMIFAKMVECRQKIKKIGRKLIILQLFENADYLIVKLII
jgi:hypothetical protein